MACTCSTCDEGVLLHQRTHLPSNVAAPANVRPSVCLCWLCSSTIKTCDASSLRIARASAHVSGLLLGSATSDGTCQEKRLKAKGTHSICDYILPSALNLAKPPAPTCAVTRYEHLAAAKYHLVTHKS